jgi:hypothetical protein
VEEAEMWIGLPAEHHLQKMAGVMREPVNVGKATLEPTGEKIDRQRESIHLGEHATMKALNAPNERQSRVVAGLKKL